MDEKQLNRALTTLTTPSFGKTGLPLNGWALPGGVCCSCGIKVGDNDRICEPCYEKKERDEKMASLLSDLRMAGDIQPNTHLCSFDRSDHELEQQNADAWMAMRKWNTKTNLYLWGPSGTGKSFGARCILLRCVELGKSVAEISARQMMKVSDRFDEGGGLFDRWCSRSVLLIDDADKVMWKPDRLSSFWEVLDRRASCGCRTIITANVDPENLTKQMSLFDQGNENMADAALDRLVPVTVIEFTGRSLRRAVSV